VVWENLANNIDWAVGARPFIGAYRSGTKEDAEGLPGRPITQITHRNDLPGIRFFRHIHRNFEVDFLALGVNPAFERQLLPQLIGGRVLIQLGLESQFIELDVDFSQLDSFSYGKSLQSVKSEMPIRR